jgi:hypothetical protein
MGKTETETINPRRDTTFEAHRKRNTTMFRKVTLALVAAASLSAMALAPTAASAKPWGNGWNGGWGGYHHHYGHGFGIGFIGGDVGGCYVTRPVMTPFGLRYRTVNVCGY